VVGCSGVSKQIDKELRDRDMACDSLIDLILSFGKR
jgi:hypothetical protein